MKLKNWFENITTENSRTKIALTLTGLVACKLFVDYVKKYRNERKITKFLSKYPEPFKGIWNPFRWTKCLIQ